MQWGAIFHLVVFGEKTPVIAPSEALVSSIKSRFEWKCASTKAEMSRFLSSLKAFLYIVSKLKGWSFLVKQLKSQAILL